MTPQFKLGISIGLIACLLAMALLPSETESRECLHYTGGNIRVVRYTHKSRN